MARGSGFGALGKNFIIVGNAQHMTGLAEESFSMAATGVAVVIGSFLLQLIWPVRVYVLVLRTSSGDVDAIMSRNKEFVSNVQKAVAQAFVVRARQAPVSET
jgi:hypothetical protein